MIHVDASPVLSRSVLVVWALTSLVALGATIDADDAQNPVGQQTPVVVAPVGTLGTNPGTNAVMIVTVGGAIAYAIGKALEVIGRSTIEWRKGWIAADAGTDHAKWEGCEREKAALAADLKRKDGVLEGQWTTIAEKDKQILSLNAQVAHLLELNRDLTMTIGHNNATLIAKMPAPSSDGIKVETAIVLPPEGGA